MNKPIMEIAVLFRGFKAWAKNLHIHNFSYAGRIRRCRRCGLTERLVAGGGECGWVIYYFDDKVKGTPLPEPQPVQEGFDL